MLSKRVYSKLKALSNTTKLRMKKRIAKKIYRRVRLDFNTALFNGYTFGVNPYIEERTVVLDTPLRIYSNSQFKKACKVLNEPIPKCTFGSTPVKRRNYRVYLKEIAYYPNSNEVETITAKVDYEKENHHKHIACIPRNS